MHATPLSLFIHQRLVAIIGWESFLQHGRGKNLPSCHLGFCANGTLQMLTCAAMKREQPVWSSGSARKVLGSLQAASTLEIAVHGND